MYHLNGIKHREYIPDAHNEREAIFIALASRLLSSVASDDSGNGMIKTEISR